MERLSQLPVNKDEAQQPSVNPVQVDRTQNPVSLTNRKPRGRAHIINAKTIQLDPKLYHTKQVKSFMVNLKLAA